MQIKNRQQMLAIAAAAGVALLVADRLVITPLKDAWKERAARIANSPGASSRGGKKSHSGSSRSSASQGGTTAQKKAAGRKGGKAAARKS